jgi:hypothetical protein
MARETYHEALAGAAMQGSNGLMRFRSGFAVLLFSVGSVAAIACSASSGALDNTGTPDGPGNGGTNGNGATGGTGGSTGGGTAGSVGIGPACDICSVFGDAYFPCNPDGSVGDSIACTEFQTCQNGKGCVSCAEGSSICNGNDVVACDASGGPGAVIESCNGSAGQICKAGKCVSGCDIAADQPSNIGCEFWAVDLDNEPDAGFGNAAAAPWAIVLSNVGTAVADVIIEQNDAAPGQPLSLTEVKKLAVPPNNLVGYVMPTREVDGGSAPGADDAPGTWLSSNAFRIRSTTPIIVYQYNNSTNSYSNDASLLLPTTALGNSYRALGWPAANGVYLAQLKPKGIPDHAYVTVVGTAEGTTVTVNPSYNILGGGMIPATAKGGTVSVTLGPFDVLNLETEAVALQGLGDISGVAPPDLTGTAISSTKPVAVFVGNERGIAPGSGKVPLPPSANGKNPDTCCTDHLEEQLLPLSSLGKNYVITRSPVRSKGWEEPDILRFVGAAATSVVETNLPAPYNKFTIQPGEVVETWTQTDILVKASEPVMVGQILVSQGWLENALTGDPSLTIFPALEQFRNAYVILTPPSWDTNYIVISTPEGNAVTIDGATTDSCTVTFFGALAGVNYESRRCAVGEGVHRLGGDKPFGIAAYGYGSAGSYAFIGGADVRRIYEPPPIK